MVPLGSSHYLQLKLRQILNAPEIKATVLPDELLYILQAFDQSGDLVDLDVVKELDAIFDDFRIFVKITDRIAQQLRIASQDAEKFARRKNCKIEPKE